MTRKEMLMYLEVVEMVGCETEKLHEIVKKRTLKKSTVEVTEDEEEKKLVLV